MYTYGNLLSPDTQFCSILVWELSSLNQGKVPICSLFTAVFSKILLVKGQFYAFFKRETNQLNALIYVMNCLTLMYSILMGIHIKSSV